MDLEELKIAYSLANGKGHSRDVIQLCEDFEQLQTKNAELKQSCEAHQEYARQRLDRIHKLEAEIERLKKELNKVRDSLRHEWNLTEKQLPDED